MAYCNLHDDMLDNTWYMSLPDNQRIVWVHLCILAARDQGVIRLTNMRLLAGRIGVTQHSLTALIASAQHRLSIEAGVSITFTDWFQWNVKRDVSKDRVRSYRERKRECNTLRNGQSNAPVTPSEEDMNGKEEDSSDATVTTESSPIEGGNAELATKAKSLLDQWNANCSTPSGAGLAEHDGSSKLFNFVIGRIRRDPAFYDKFKTVLEALGVLDNYRGNNASKYTLKLSYLITNDYVTTKILNEYKAYNAIKINTRGRSNGQTADTGTLKSSIVNGVRVWG